MADYQYDPLFCVISDDVFSTPKDYLFAKFIALEKLRNLIIAKVDVLDGVIKKELSAKLLSTSLCWTAGKTDLVELAYGIYLNDGKAELKDIVLWLENSLSVNLGYIYRKFIDITRRKTLSYNHYLNEMISRINSHVLGKD